MSVVGSTYLTQVPSRMIDAITFAYVHVPAKQRVSLLQWYSRPSFVLGRTQNQSIYIKILRLVMIIKIIITEKWKN